MNRLVTLAIAGFIALVLISSTMFVVDQRRYAVVFSFGKYQETITEPGLHFKLPRPFQNVIYLDKRILTIESREADRFITKEKMNVLVDAFVKWQIVDPRLYFVSFGGDETRARSRMEQIIKAALNDAITTATVREVISAKRGAVMRQIQERTAIDGKQIGVRILDVRLKRVDYVEQINVAVYERMKAERLRVANDQRARGRAESEQIRAEADRKATVILAEAYRDAERMRGEGDAKASAIYASSFGKNPEFYKFYRSLEAYRASFRNKNDVMVLDSKSEFFKYFRSPSGK